MKDHEREGIDFFFWVKRRNRFFFLGKEKGPIEKSIKEINKR